MNHEETMRPSDRRKEITDTIAALSPVQARAALAAIALALDGEDWGGDQLETIGFVFKVLFNNVGITFLSPEEWEEMADRAEGGGS